MAGTSSMSAAQPKGHICPKSTATHPSDRWESMFVYSFICKFTQLRGKIEGLESPMDFENALLEREPNLILTKLLAHFILNLRPHTRNLSMDQISTTVASVLSEYFKSSERTIFWNDDLKMNVDPFDGLEGGFFTADWDFKLQILRQLVELQLCHTVDIKSTIDRAWGVVHNKHKKKDGTARPPDSTDPQSQERLQVVPIGQDSRRKRYWVADDSPRVYVSTNPWKTTATFQTVSSTREEYLTVIEELKSSAPVESKGDRRTKLETAHLNLIVALESRTEAIDTEIARVQKVRKKIEQRNVLIAQAEIRETRTRRQTQRPDYVYTHDGDSEDDGDEYTYQEEDERYDDDDFDADDFLNFRTDMPNGTSHRRSSVSVGQRRSTRTAALNANGKRTAAAEDSWSQWRGERRSSRLGAPPDIQLDVEPPTKRARTEDSTFSTNSADAPSAVDSVVSNNNNGESSGFKIKIRGAAAVKPTEIALEQVAGKKKSKFWFYAVEPIPGAVPPVSVGPGEAPTNGTHNSDLINGSNGSAQPEGNGHEDHRTNGHEYLPLDAENQMDVERRLEGSLSPMDST